MNSSSLILPPLSALYHLAVRTRNAAYKNGFLTTTKLNAPVISVGNITVGGTGKTPLVELISRTLAADGKRVCILTRGYGRENPKSRVVVSDGRTVKANASEAGDEALQLAENLKGEAAVVSDSNRVAAGQWAIKQFGTDVFVLDDGFQHIQLARDLDVVTIDATDPWGANQLLPYGRLREPVGGLSRADCVVLTRFDPAVHKELIARVEDLTRGKPVFTSSMRVKGFRTLDDTESLFNSIVQPSAAFCGVGNPKSFFRQLELNGSVLVMTKAFSDHHNYTQADLDFLSEQAAAAGARTLFTTKKDAVKLRTLKTGLPTYVVEIEISIDDAAKFLSLIRDVVSSRGPMGALAAE